MTVLMTFLPKEQGMRTPPWLFAFARTLTSVEFKLDAFASVEDALCTNYYDVAANGLVQPWLDATFANPPFNLMAKVVDKALTEAADRHQTSVLIGPAGCSQQWFHRLIKFAGTTVYFPDRRLQFLQPDGTPTRNAMADAAVYRLHGRQRRRGGVDVQTFHVPGGLK